MTERSSDILRLLSYNIHGCFGRWGVEDPDRVLDVLRTVDADVVALQEVHDDDIADRSFLRGLETLGYASIIYGRTMRMHKGPFGNILMTRQKPHITQRADISIDGVEPRGAIIAILDTEHGQVRVMASHFGMTSGERHSQLNQILAIHDTPLEAASLRAQILMGDLNEWFPWSRNLKLLRSMFPACSEIRTFPAILPVFALDKIGISGRIAGARFWSPDFETARTASDHRPIAAEVRF